MVSGRWELLDPVWTQEADHVHAILLPTIQFINTLTVQARRQRRTAPYLKRPSPLDAGDHRQGDATQEHGAGGGNRHHKSQLILGG